MHRVGLVDILRLQDQHDWHLKEQIDPWLKVPMQRNRTDYFAGGNVSVPFESSGMIDAIRKYMRE